MRNSSIASHISDLLEEYVISSSTACITIFGVSLFIFAYCMYKWGSEEQEYDFFVSNIDNGIGIYDADDEPITDDEKKAEVFHSICKNYELSLLRYKAFSILHLFILFMCLVFALF